MRIVKVEIVDNDDTGGLETYYLVNPGRTNLNVLKHMIEHRFDAALDFCDNIWDEVSHFINANFTTIEVENFEIEY